MATSRDDLCLEIIAPHPPPGQTSSAIQPHNFGLETTAANTPPNQSSFAPDHPTDPTPKQPATFKDPEHADNPLSKPTWSERIICWMVLVTSVLLLIGSLLVLVLSPKSKSPALLGVCIGLITFSLLFAALSIGYLVFRGRNWPWERSRG